MRQSTLDKYFSRLEILDTQEVQSLDERLTACLESFLDAKSKFYLRVEVDGQDPFEKLIVVGHSKQTLKESKRVCFHPDKCNCTVDDEPWESFSIDDDASDISMTELSSNQAKNEAENDVGLQDMKRQYGFVPTQQDASSLEQDAKELVKRQRLMGRMSQESAASTSSSNVGARASSTQPPRQVYMNRVRWATSSTSIAKCLTVLLGDQCKENGVESKRAVRDLLIVRDGVLRLNLSSIGFLSPDDLDDISFVVSETSRYVPVDMLDLSNCFCNRQAFDALCRLARVPFVRERVKILSLRGLSLPRRGDLSKLLAAFTVEGQLHEIDLSYNTLTRGTAQCIEPLLRTQGSIERLKLASCIPKPDMMSADELIEIVGAVRAAFLASSSKTSLKCVDLSGGWAHHSWLSALLSPESPVQELLLSQARFFTLAGEIGDSNQPSNLELHLDNLVSLSVSEVLGQNEFRSILNGLQRGFQIGFMQLKELDVSFLPFNNQEQVETLVEQLRDYGGLSSLTLRWEDSEARDMKIEKLKQLAAGGLLECKSLCLTVGNVRSIRQMEEFIADCTLPKASTIELSARLATHEADCIRETQDELMNYGRLMGRSFMSPDRFGSATSIKMRIELPGNVEPTNQHYLRVLDMLFTEIQRTWLTAENNLGQKRRLCSLSRPPNALDTSSWAVFMCTLTAK